MRGLVTRMARICQDIVRCRERFPSDSRPGRYAETRAKAKCGDTCHAQNANGNADGIVVRLRVGRRVGVGWGCWGLRPLLGGLVRGVLALRAVAFGEAAAQDTAEDGEADAADEEDDAAG